MSMFDWALSLHVALFEASLMGQLALGMSPFLYQTPGGRFVPAPSAGEVLSAAAAWFKAFRTPLSAGDGIHVSRPDGQVRGLPRVRVQQQQRPRARVLASCESTLPHTHTLTCARVNVFHAL
jgi:hypothetical protein